MSQPNIKAEQMEYRNTLAKITIKVHDIEITRVYGIEDGQLSEKAKEELQEVVDTLLDTSEI